MWWGLIILLALVYVVWLVYELKKAPTLKDPKQILKKADSPTGEAPSIDEEVL